MTISSIFRRRSSMRAMRMARFSRFLSCPRARESICPNERVRASPSWRSLSSCRSNLPVCSRTAPTKVRMASRMSACLFSHHKYKMHWLFVEGPRTLYMDVERSQTRNNRSKENIGHRFSLCAIRRTAAVPIELLEYYRIYAGATTGNGRCYTHISLFLWTKSTCTEETQGVHVYVPIYSIFPTAVFERLNLGRSPLCCC